MYKWKVCPIQGRQLKDVREKDIIGDFRLCHTYRGGGGYDQYPKIALKRGVATNLSIGDTALQFVVQLYGCHLDCPYCYVTKDGTLGRYVEYTSKEILDAFYSAIEEHGCGVFHLMGGSPALYLNEWPVFVRHTWPLFLFHSDLLLTERKYTSFELSQIKWDHALYAVNIKGVTSEDYYKNTGRRLDTKLFWHNFDRVVSSGINFYLTFTNPDLSYLEEYKENLIVRYGKEVLKDSFVINLIDYEALKGE
jgi:pyruvate-formate lyase-activating enzyme